MNNYDDLLDNTPSGAQGGQFSKEEWAAKKQAEREALYALAGDTALAVAGDGGKFAKYLDTQATFARYSVTNALLILAQKPEATRLGDFEFWKGKGAYVKQGETGVSILEPGKEYERRDGGGTAVSYNVKKVFDVSQVDASKTKAVPPPIYDNRQLLRALVSNAPVKVAGVDELAGDSGVEYDQAANIIRVRKGMEFNRTFRCLAQELAYAGMVAGPNTPADPHFSACCASYMLCRIYGVNTQGFDFTGAPEMLDGMDAQDIRGELTQIRNVVEDISAQIERQLAAGRAAMSRPEAR